MSYEGDDDDDDEGLGDLIFSVILAGAAYFVTRYMQAQLAGAGSIFQPAASPAYPYSDYSGPQAPAILTPMQLSPAGAATLKRREGFRSRSYPDAGGRSIGYGHKIRPGERFVEPITRADAEGLFASDAGAVSQAINSALVVPVSQNAFDALVSFGYNEGAGALLSSTLWQDLNAGDYQGAAAQFGVWNKANGQINQALVSRRADEAAQFLS